MRARLSICPRVSALLGAAFAVAALLSPEPASAQRVSVDVSAAEGSTATVDVENGYDFAVKAVNVRLGFNAPDGSRIHYYSEAGWVEDLEPGAVWTGTLNFLGEDGAPVPEGVDLSDPDTRSVAAGVDLDAIAPAATAAAEGGEMEAIGEQLAFVRARVAPVSRSARFHADQVAASGIPVNQWFDVERIDGLVSALESAACESASTRYMRARRSQLDDLYVSLSEELRGLNLHINCLNTEAKLKAAARLTENGRPQDALTLVEVEDGVPLPEWRDTYVNGNLALARTAAELNVSAFSSIRPALEAISDVKRVAPDHRGLSEVADVLIPNAARWLQTACEPMTRDLQNAEAAIQILRPTWSEYEQVEQAAGAFAGAMIEEGLEQCNLRNFINSRNRFDRGARILEGVPEWEERAEEINRCRAMGSLQEGRETANHPTDPTGPERGYAKLDEARGRYDLPQEEIDRFKADVAQAYVNLALRQIEESAYPIAFSNLETAEEISPTGRTDEMRLAWIGYGEQLYADGGLLMTGENVQEARDALARAESVDEDRSGALASKLTMAFYGYRVAIPLLVFLLLLVGGVYTVANKRKAAKYQAELDDEDY